MVRDPEPRAFPQPGSASTRTRSGPAATVDGPIEGATAEPPGSSSGARGPVPRRGPPEAERAARAGGDSARGAERAAPAGGDSTSTHTRGQAPRTSRRTDVGDRPGVPDAWIGGLAPRFRGDVVNADRAGIERLSLRQRVGPEASDPGPVVLAFAASWCAPCHRELRALSTEAARATLRERGVLLVVLVVDDTSEGRAEMLRLLRDEMETPHPVLLDEFQIVQRRYGVGRLPTMVVVDAQGRIAWRREGFEEDSLGELADVLGALAGGSPAASDSVPGKR